MIQSKTYNIPNKNPKHLQNFGEEDVQTVNQLKKTWKKTRRNQENIFVDK